MNDTDAAVADAVTDPVDDGRRAAIVHAPRAAASLDALEQTVWQVLDPDLVDLAARLCASVHGLSPLARPAALGPSPFTDRDVTLWRTFDDLTGAQRVALVFAEQFTTDVSSVTPAQRDALQDAFGEHALVFAHVLYVVDVVPRARAALDRFFGESSLVGPARPVDSPHADLWAAIQANVRIVPGLDQLDPVTSELVRLRCARLHNCRICKSLRSFTAFAAGADETTFEAVDFYEKSDLSDAVKSALALVDAMVWTPGRLPDLVIENVRAHFTPAQQVELILDVARHATNKFAVSMAVDTPHVDDGIEVYLVAADGSTTYGLERP